ncbi:UDP-N-acetylmuramoyl-L-alanyl-D-glutamate--2,6-diaminopimelate ligase [Modestobacter sp. VKM Ac-2986]|uniref:Mur ligase family protein n=1 Tax=Modestobacter sp. VKM Ac-2986 TaxID=3004140 RepID=UPI0022AA1523|nr:UDP-N-acetylmuramoyl-L-alanyl-D-glutamate--2,6-diaminopimelate ligase [Modestobacter sp. VKM Ac-2986]MCZ2828120.1 UDP-N-acetylmuramoyl-L-alanyl-D-glutamate--2,6-diaminopimelate ligase [Modestobacter sp. VKM Ac-2986]
MSFPGVVWSAVERRARTAATGPVVASGATDGLVLHGLVTDSRAVTPGCLFACVRGGRSDGHRFAATAVAAGAAALLVDRPVDVDVPQLLVPSVRAQLGPLGALLAGDPADRLRLVGVTGSNGKTTTSTLVRGVLQAAGECAGVVTTLGARVGDQTRSTRLTTPEAPELHGLLAWMLDAGATSAVVEASSIALDVGRVDGVHVSVAIFTGFEEDHLDHHGTIEQYWASKARLFTPERTDSAVVVVDEPWGRRLADQARVPVTRVSATDDPTADVRVVSWQTGAAGTNLVVEDADGRHWLSSPLVGRVHVGNLAAAWATGRAMGISPQTVAAGLATTAPPAGRNTLLRADAGPLVVVDYAHTPRALAAALQTAHELTGPGGRVHLVLGARGRRDRYKRQGLGVSARAADTVWLTNEGSHGERPESIVEELRVGLLGGTAEVHTVLDRRAAIAAAVQAGGAADVVIVVGRGHETTMTDDGAPVAFDDAVVAREVLAARAARESAPNVVRTMTGVTAADLVAERAS